MQKTLISIVGPTASGKTKLSLDLATALHTSIISADSRQFYKSMNIGTAKPLEEDLIKVPHYFINHLELEDDYSAGAFEQQALQLLEKLFEEQDYVIAVGGSGLYLQALWEGLDEFPDIPQEVRDELNARLETMGLEALQEDLKEADPEFYEKGEIQNPQRVIRALEVSQYTGEPFSSFKKGEKKERPFDVLKIGLEMDRERLYERINSRVDRMMALGLEEEAQILYAKQHYNALQTVGYQELFEHFNGFYDKKEAVEKIKQNTRRYAKRQLTWFKKQDDIHWFQPEEKKQIFAFVSEKLGLEEFH